MTHGCIPPTGNNATNTELISDAGDAEWQQTQLLFWIVGIFVAFLSLIPYFVIKNEEKLNSTSEQSEDEECPLQRCNSTDYPQVTLFNQRNSGQEVPQHQTEEITLSPK